MANKASDVRRQVMRGSLEDDGFMVAAVCLLVTLLGLIAYDVTRPVAATPASVGVNVTARSESLVVATPNPEPPAPSEDNPAITEAGEVPASEQMASPPLIEYPQTSAAEQPADVARPRQYGGATAATPMTAVPPPPAAPAPPRTGNCQNRGVRPVPGAAELIPGLPAVTANLRIIGCQ